MEPCYFAFHHRERVVFVGVSHYIFILSFSSDGSGYSSILAKICLGERVRLLSYGCFACIVSTKACTITFCSSTHISTYVSNGVLIILQVTHVENVPSENALLAATVSGGIEMWQYPGHVLLMSLKAPSGFLFAPRVTFID